MSVLDRSALEASPLADLHAIASELSIDGYRRLRKPELIDAILARQEGGEPAEPKATPAPRSRRARKEPKEDANGEAKKDEGAGAETETDEDEEPSGRRRRGRRGGPGERRRGRHRGGGARGGRGA